MGCWGSNMYGGTFGSNRGTLSGTRNQIRVGHIQGKNLNLLCSLPGLIGNQPLDCFSFLGTRL